MKKINLRKISDILSDKALKNVLGGYGNGGCAYWCVDHNDVIIMYGYTEIPGFYCVPNAQSVCLKKGLITVCTSGCYPY